MARPLRIEFPGALYHIITRGVARMATFCEDADYWKFLRLLKREVDLGTLIIHAFSLMPNHPHMLCETPGGGLHRWMKRLLGGYAQSFNLKYARFGHLFQARYRALLVEEGDYFLKCSRYIHRNPSQAHLVPTPDLYPWSSYRNYLQQPAVVDWVETGKIQGFFTGPGQYQAFVEAGGDDELEDPFAQAKAGLVFGSNEFLDKIRALVADRKDQAEIPSLKSLMRITDPPGHRDVASAVDRVFFDAPARARRRILIYALHCFSWLSGREIADLVSLSPSGVSRAAHQMHDALLRDKTLQERFEQLGYILQDRVGRRNLYLTASPAESRIGETAYDLLNAIMW